MENNQVQWRLGHLEDVTKKLSEDVTELKTHQEAERTDLARAFDAIREVAMNLATYIAKQTEADDTRRRERKADFKWIIATVIVTAGVVITAYGVLGHT